MGSPVSPPLRDARRSISADRCSFSDSLFCASAYVCKPSYSLCYASVSLTRSSASQLLSSSSLANDSWRRIDSSGSHSHHSVNHCYHSVKARERLEMPRNCFVHFGGGFGLGFPKP